MAINEGLHYNLDLLPTLADLLGQQAGDRWDGQSYANAVLEGAQTGRPYLVISQCAHVCQRSVRFGPWLYMRTYHDGYHLFPEEMLFDLENDPHEQHNLAAQHPALCCQAVGYLNEWHATMMQSQPDAVDPLWTVMREGGPFHARGKLKSYCRHLERTGRGHAIPELKRRHPSEFR